MTEILFWKGIISPREDLKNFEETVSKILRGEYRAANLDLKKCRGFSLYTVRVNRSDRLLFTTVMRDGKPYLLLLEVISNHDYHKSRFLNNPELLKQFIENTDIQHAAIINEDNFLEVDSEAEDSLSQLNKSESSPEHNTIVERAVFYFNQSYLVFNDQQEQAVQAKLPMIISGAPGSGKSCVALSCLASATEVLSDDNTIRKGLYLTRSPHLVEQMSRSWSALPASLCRDFKVEFKSYEDLLLTAQPQLRKRESCGIIQFEFWFTTDFIRQAQNRKQLNSRTQTPLKKLMDKKALIYLELRVISGYEEKDYISLGQKRSLFQEEAERAQLYNIYQTYSRYLNENNYYDPAFCALPLLQEYDLVVVDEGQDFSLQQLKNLLAVAGDKLSICYDPNQSLDDAQSILGYLKDHFYKKQIKVTKIEFHETYRCPADIADIANRVLDIKQSLAGRADKQEAKAIIPAKGLNNKGEVRWLETIDEAERSQIAEQASHTDFAIVTSEEFKEEAGALFKTPLIFTPAEIKGLEYPVVLVYRLIEGTDYIQISKSLNAGKHIDNRDLRPAFNALFTTFTRAMATLIIFQPPYRKTAELIKKLKTGLPQIDPTRKAITPVLSKVSRSNDWVKQYELQLNLGNFKQAEAIKCQYLPLEAEMAASALPEAVAASASRAAPARTVITTPKQRNKKKTVELKQQPSKPTTPKPKAVRLNKTQENLLKNLSKHCTFNFLKKAFIKDDVLELLFEKNPLDPNADVSLFGSMLSSDENVDIVFNFLEKNPVFIKKLTLRLLSKPWEFGGDIKHVDHTFRLIMSHQGRAQKILRLIFEASPDVALNMPMETLFIYYSGVNNFFALSATIDGRKCLRILLNTNKDFIKHLQAKDLFLIAENSPSRVIDKFTKSPFSFLSEALLYQDDFLYDLVKTKPELVEGATARDIFTVYSHSGQTSPIETILFMFSGFPKGIELLHIIFSKNKHLAESSEAKSIFKADYRYRRHIPSAFSYLTTKPPGIMFLSLLFDQNESLIQEITLDDFFRIYTIHPQNAAEIISSVLVSSFSMLCTLREGAALLYKILILRKDLLDAIEFEYLLGTKDTPGFAGLDLSNNNLFSLLDTNNLDVIELIFKSHPEFIDRLEPQQLDQQVNLSTFHPHANKTLRDILKSEAFTSIKALLQSRKPALFYPETSSTHPSRLFSSISQDNNAAEVESANLRPDV